MKTKLEAMSLNEIRKSGVEALVKNLGPIGMVRFLQQFDLGKGDYTAQRGQWLDEMDLNNIIAEIKNKRKK